MLNVTTLIANCWPALHAASAADVVFTDDPIITRAIADCLKRLAQQFGVFVVRDVGTVLVQGTAVYNAPVRHVSTLHIAILETGRPLIPSSTKEQELRNGTFATTQATATAPIRYWYSDKIGINKIGLSPVPGLLDVGNHLEVIFHQYPCNLDPAHLDPNIRAPKWVGDYCEAVALSEQYSKESDFQIPESAQGYKQLAMLYEQLIPVSWGRAQ